MNGLWADGWFYISSAGLLVSGTLFFFLLGQYRAASEAADITEAEQGVEKEAAAPATIRPVYTPEPVAAAPVASHSEVKAAEARPEPRAEAEAPVRRSDPANTTGGISPAVVYLQNIKIELAELHKEMSALAKRVDDQLSAGTARDEALIERLGELTRVVGDLQVAAAPPPASPKKGRKTAPEPAAEPAPEPAPEPAAPPAPETAAEPASIDLSALTLAVPAPAPAPAPESAPEPAPAPAKQSETERRADETIRMDLSALVAPPVAAEPAPSASPETVEPAPASQEPPPEEKPRRGPVWPV